MAAGFRAGEADGITLPVNAQNEHGASVLVAAGLVWGDDRRLIFQRGNVSQNFAVTALAEAVRTTAKLNGVIRVHRRKSMLHGAVMLVAERENVGAHAGSEFSTARRAMKFTSPGEAEGEREAEGELRWRRPAQNVLSARGRIAGGRRTDVRNWFFVQQQFRALHPRMAMEP